MNNEITPTEVCYFCDMEVESTTREQIFIPAIGRHVPGYVCPTDMPRLRRRQAEARSEVVGR